MYMYMCKYITLKSILKSQELENETNSIRLLGPTGEGIDNAKKHNIAHPQSQETQYCTPTNAPGQRTMVSESMRLAMPPCLPYYPDCSFLILQGSRIVTVSIASMIIVCWDWHINQTQLYSPNNYVQVVIHRILVLHTCMLIIVPLAKPNSLVMVLAAMNWVAYNDVCLIDRNLSKADTVGTNKIVHHRGCVLWPGVYYRPCGLHWGFSKCPLQWAEWCFLRGAPPY